MDYREEKFYEFMGRRIREIDTLDINDEEKEKLYYFIDKTIEIYQKFDEYLLTNELATLVKNQSQIEMERASKKIYHNMKILSNLEKMGVQKRGMYVKLSSFEDCSPISMN